MNSLLKVASALQEAKSIPELTNIIWNINTLYTRMHDEIRAAMARLDYEPSLDFVSILYLMLTVDESKETYSLLEEYCRNTMNRHGDSMESMIRTIFQTRDRGDEEWEKALLVSTAIVVTNSKEFSTKPYPAIAIFFVYGMIQAYYLQDDYRDAPTIVREMDAATIGQNVPVQIRHNQIFRRIAIIRSAMNDQKIDYLITIDRTSCVTLSHDRAYRIIEKRYEKYMDYESIRVVADNVSTDMFDFMGDYERYSGSPIKISAIYDAFKMTMQKDIEIIRAIMNVQSDDIVRAFLFDCFHLRVQRGMHDQDYPDIRMIQDYLNNLTFSPQTHPEDLDERTRGIVWALQLKPEEEQSAIDWDAIRIQDEPPANETALEAYDRKSTTVNKASQKIYNGFKAYKNAEDKVDSQLAKMITATKRLFMGDARTEIVEGKEFSPIGLLKKALATAAIFSYSKVGGLIFLVVRYALRKNSTMAEKKNILMEIETELKMLDEKIEDARGDGNRQAKYAMMRTRSELQNAYNKIKYGLEADRRSMSTAKRIVGAGQSSADAYERRRKK